MSGIISAIAGSILGLGSGIFLFRNHQNHNAKFCQDSYTRGITDEQNYLRDKEWASKYVDTEIKNIDDIDDIDRWYIRETKDEFDTQYGWNYQELIKARYRESLLQEAYIEKCKKEKHESECDPNKLFENYLKSYPYMQYIINHQRKTLYKYDEWNFS